MFSATASSSIADSSAKTPLASETGRVDERLREFFVAGGLLVSIVHDGDEAAVAGCAEGDALDRVRAVADAVIHLAPRQHHLDPPLGYTRTECSERYVWPSTQR
jgi:hypothetical protein